jgi:triosephosphate isomerase (TIM)
MADRKPLMAGNWKMHHNHLEAIQVVQKLSYRLEKQDYDAVEVVVCPAFTALRSVQTTLEGDRIPIGLGAQNCYFENEGPYTGEVSPTMLQKLIVGHSERRQLMGETDEIVSKKLRAVLAVDMQPIVCVGETLEQREAGETDDFVAGQVRAAFLNVPAEKAERCVVAYEPIWAIGTGRNATPDDANATIGVVRSTLRDMIGGSADEMRILYGGSMKPGNAADLMAMPEIDGGLVGGASLDPDDYARIIPAGPIPPYSGPSSLIPQEETRAVIINATLIVIQVTVSLILIVFILLHSGRGGGLSDMFGGVAGGSSAGSTVVERNLDRLTVVVSLVFAFTTMLLSLRL